MYDAIVKERKTRTTKRTHELKVLKTVNKNIKLEKREYHINLYEH